jgi:hypothetical protein
MIFKGKRTSVDAKRINAVLMCLLMCFVCVLSAGCEDYSMERRFIRDTPPANRLVKLRGYSLEDQYRIFRYGNDKVEPPLTVLAVPIAERGSSAVPFLLGKLERQPDILTVRDLLLIFQTMKNLGKYDISSNQNIMQALRKSIDGLKDKEWRNICGEMLARLSKRAEPD